MALTEYRRKRDFTRTPEPAGGVAAAEPGAPLSFVIQKHKARRLHYDFRLELGGVLKSWAVPKGPSLDPGEKRLAVHVEDHPLDYGGFEGVIPEGEYGGGTVMLWDRGTWQPLDPDPAQAYADGALKFVLDGAKLHGKWALVRMGGKAATARRENWLLIKERDAVAAPGSGDAVVSDNPRSAASGRTIDQIAAARDRVWASNRAADGADAADIAVRVPRARRAEIPGDLHPQLATAADKAPEGPEWLHEIKYDGYRLLARLANRKVILSTRNGLDWTAKFPALAESLARLPVASAVLDGELVHLEPNGTTSFSGLQDKIATGRTEALTFFAFDLLYLEGWDLTRAALEDRKAALAELVPPQASGMLRYSDHQAGRGADFFRHACGYALEGIVSKRRDRPYQPGRGAGWLKVKCTCRDEFVVIGFTDPEGARQGFGALVVGYYAPAGELRYAGRVGTGFADAELVELRRRLDAIERDTPPVASLPKDAPKKGMHWTEPFLVAEIRFGNWTADHILRHAAFEGLREDKSATEVVHDPPAAPARPPAAPAPASRPGRGGRDTSTDFAGVRLTHPERLMYPEDGTTKLDLARYYAAIADWALPHLALRPLSLVRCPEGIAGQCFFQKHGGAGVPAAVGRVEIPDKTGSKTHLVIADLAGLLSLVQMGVIEIHPWGSTATRLETPDRVTFDLDPDVGLPWSRVCAAAVELREMLKGLGLHSFAKTTGGKGLHVVVPLAPKLDWDAVKGFAKRVADRLAEERPERYTVNQAKRARVGRIYLDYLRNTRGATAVGAYSPRARPGAPVSTPLFWCEVEAGVRPEGFTVASVPGRLAKLAADPWADIGKIRQSLRAAARKKLGL
jgi:bifunctional non-homologous end joining protein LigD